MDPDNEGVSGLAVEPFGAGPRSLDTTVSCTIPTHGRDDTLAAALMSVRNQTLPPGTTVVVDDLASISTRALVETIPHTSYRDGSTILVKGAGASRNLGAEAGQGDVLAFLDDDDEWAPTFLASCIAKLQEENADFVVAWSDLVALDGRSHPSSRMRGGLNAKGVLSRNPGFTGSNFIVTRTAFERVGGFDPGLWVSNDLDLLVRLLDAGYNYAVVSRVLVKLGVGASGHLSSRSERQARGLEDYSTKYRHRLHGRDRRRLRRAINLAHRYPERGKYWKVFHLILQWANSTPSDLTDVVRRRLEGRARPYS